MEEQNHVTLFLELRHFEHTPRVDRQPQVLNLSIYSLPATQGQRYAEEGPGTGPKPL